MARYQVILAYDGTDFFGFQRQAQARTVQGEFESALRVLGWQGQSLLSAGRTDTGVHAAGQVVAFDLDWRHPPKALQRAVNANLPADLSAVHAAQVSADFHPRYDALARHYRYRLLAEAVRQPLLERYAWRVWPAPDLGRLQTASQLMVGTFDFAAFGAPMKAGGSTQRTVYRAEWRQAGAEFVFDIVGNAFLYRMVRRLVAYQLEIGIGRLQPEMLLEQLRKPGDTSFAGTAKPAGLCLMAVYYAGQVGEEKYLEEMEIRRN
ncbi:MAG: tRNA pseudouridine(38-40) synthase TruA [Anaerolineales bacterium]|jgi:tRNA pseudouridine38-40 synthase